MRTEDVEIDSVQEIRSEYVRHFLSEEFVVGRDAEARLFKSIIDTITAEDVRQVAEQLRSSASCVVKAVSHRRCDLNAFASAPACLPACLGCTNVFKVSVSPKTEVWRARQLLFRCK